MRCSRRRSTIQRMSPLLSPFSGAGERRRRHVLYCHPIILSDPAHELERYLLPSCHHQLDCKTEKFCSSWREHGFWNPGSVRNIRGMAILLMQGEYSICSIKREHITMFLAISAHLFLFHNSTETMVWKSVDSRTEVTKSGDSSQSMALSHTFEKNYGWNGIYVGSLVVLFAIRSILSRVFCRSGASARPFHKTYTEHVEQVQHPLSKIDVELNVGR